MSTVVVFVAYALVLAAQSVMFAHLGERWWKALIPVYSSYRLAQATGNPTWFSAIFVLGDLCMRGLWIYIRLYGTQPLLFAALMASGLLYAICSLAAYMKAARVLGFGRPWGVAIALSPFAFMPATALALLSRSRLGARNTLSLKLGAVTAAACLAALALLSVASGQGLSVVTISTFAGSLAFACSVLGWWGRPDYRTPSSAVVTILTCLVAVSSAFATGRLLFEGASYITAQGTVDTTTPIHSADSTEGLIWDAISSKEEASSNDEQDPESQNDAAEVMDKVNQDSYNSTYSDLAYEDFVCYTSPATGLSATAHIDDRLAKDDAVNAFNETAEANEPKMLFSISTPDGVLTGMQMPTGGAGKTTWNLRDEALASAYEEAAFIQDNGITLHPGQVNISGTAYATMTMTDSGSSTVLLYAPGVGGEEEFYSSTAATEEEAIALIVDRIAIAQ